MACRRLYLVKPLSEELVILGHFAERFIEAHDVADLLETTTLSAAESMPNAASRCASDISRKLTPWRT